MIKFNGIDWFSLAILLAFAVEACLKGFVAEIIDILVLVISILVTIIAAPYMAKYLMTQMPILPAFSSVIVFILSFAFFFILIKLISLPLKKAVHHEMDVDASIDTVDRVLGFLVGLVKGVAVLCGVYAIYFLYVKPIHFASLNQLFDTSFFVNLARKTVFTLPVIKNILRF